MCQATARWCASLALVLAPVFPAAVRASPWKAEMTEQGLTVSTREVPGRDLPLVKAEGTIAENMYDLLAVLNDVRRHTEWMVSISRSELLARPSEFDLLVYFFFDAPWPVSNRDAVVRIKVLRSQSGHAVMVSMKGSSSRQRPPGSAIRAPRLNATARLRMLGRGLTWVRYEIDIDPGGWLPRWLVRWLLRRLPLKTLRRLRKQVRKTRGQYNAFHRRWAPRSPPMRAGAEDTAR